MFVKKPKPQGRIESLIGAGTRVEGNITFSGGLRIDGEVHGNVTAAEGQAGTLVISEQARIEGGVTVAHLVVNGTIVGPVHCRDFLELQSRARVTGDMEYSTVEMHLGAIVQGRLIHQGAPTKSVELKLAAGSN
ncbi:MAG: polymer-forming cytoskeletal protein [Proteobacteria bacterium]|nr:polymer-forming cytoskeletal protein [Pseudomonadota bacterium]HQR05133.1 polymer-forming cytoskeletal protein [Rhodocyclaceae bacterium]